jgi:hypothetical protein
MANKPFEEFLNPISSHQTVRKTNCNAVGFNFATDCHADGCIAGVCVFLGSTAGFRLRAIENERG